MSRLTIADLSFCEIELASNSQMQGGGITTVYSPIGSWSVSYNSTNSSGDYTGWFFDSGTGSLGNVATAYSSGTVARTEAGVLADGTKYASSFSQSSL